MPTALRRTTLSVMYDITPTESSFIYEMASTSRESLAFDTGGEVITDADFALRRLDSDEDVSASIEGSSILTDTALVTISNLVRTVTYELLVTFTFSDGEREAHTLILDCVA